MKLILTADDYGMDDNISESILQCIGNGTITSTNVMVNLVSDLYVQKLLKFKDTCSIGIHINLTYGGPIEGINGVESLADERGMFYDYPIFMEKFNSHQINLNHLRQEIERQFLTFIKLFGKPLYWNTHQNISMNLKIASIIRKIAKKYGVYSTRTFYRAYIDFDLLNIKRKLIEVFKQILLFAYFRFFLRKKIKSTQRRLIVFHNPNKLNFSKLISLTKYKGSIEIVFHPSLINNAAGYGTLSSYRRQEHDFLVSEQVKWFFKNNFKLISFGDF